MTPILQESYEQKSAGFEIRSGDGRAMLEEMAAKIEGVFKKNEASLRVSDITTRNVQLSTFQGWAKNVLMGTRFGEFCSCCCSPLLP